MKNLTLCVSLSLGILGLLTGCSGGGSNVTVDDGGTVANNITATMFPPNGSTGALVNTAITIRFNFAMKLSTANVGSIVVTDPGGTPVPGVFQYASPDETSVSFQPSAPLAYNTTYTVTLSRHIEDAQGDFFKGAVYTFTTASDSITFVGTPGTSAPPATLGSHSMTVFPLDTRALTLNEANVESPLTGVVGFSPSLNHRRIGAGWATWSHGYTGDVYVVSGNTVTLTMPAGTDAFYFYAEPNSFSTWDITATAQDGTTGTLSVVGASGAKYFGFYSGSPLTTITVGIDPLTTGFAVGEFGIESH